MDIKNILKIKILYQKYFHLFMSNILKFYKDNFITILNMNSNNIKKMNVNLDLFKIPNVTKNKKNQNLIIKLR